MNSSILSLAIPRIAALMVSLFLIEQFARPVDGYRPWSIPL